MDLFILGAMEVKSASEDVKDNDCDHDSSWLSFWFWPWFFEVMVENALDEEVAFPHEFDKRGRALFLQERVRLATTLQDDII